MHPSPAEEFSTVASLLAALIGIVLLVRSFRPPAGPGRNGDETSP